MASTTLHIQYLAQIENSSVKWQVAFWKPFPQSDSSGEKWQMPIVQDLFQVDNISGQWHVAHLKALSSAHQHWREKASSHLEGSFSA